MKDNQKVLLSFVVGAAAGVAAGILLAPYSGKDSRKKIADNASKLSSDLSGQLGVSLEKLTDLKNTVISTISELTGKAIDKGNKVVDYGTNKAKEAADKVTNNANV